MWFPACTRAATFSCRLPISRWPVMQYSIDRPSRNRPLPSWLNIMYFVAANSVRPRVRATISEQADMVMISMNT